MSKNITSKKIRQICSCKNIKELENLYDKWAPTYEGHQDGYNGIQGRIKTVNKFISWIKIKDIKILDAGCGTGRLAILLKKHGYKNIVGIDISKEMLKIANDRDLYTKLYKLELGRHLTFPDNSFEGVISCGVFTEGHATAKAFDELIRVTKKRGYIVFTLREDIYEKNNFKEKQNYLEFNKYWKLVEITKPFLMLPKGSKLMHRIWVYEKLQKGERK